MKQDNLDPKEQLSKFQSKAKELKALNLNLDLTRGKPCSRQLDLSNDIESCLNNNFISEDGTDCRNYGIIDGIKEAKELFSKILEVPTENTLIGGNSSLTLMYQYMSHAYHFGVKGNESAWSKLKTPSFLCPSPGYDRHFAICEALGIKMIPIEMTNDGPNMDQAEDILRKDNSCCGIWCVPKYSNPTGVVYSKEVVQRIANLQKLTNTNFRVFWDNAYALHHFNNDNHLENIFTIASEAGLDDSIVIFSSTSKITFAGSGVAFLGSSKNNLNSFKSFLSFQTIGPDKVNQLKHVKFFKDLNGMKNQMKKHAEILFPKFQSVLKVLDDELSGLKIEGNDLAKWTKPDGGYFISIDTLPGLAKKTVSLCNELGVKLTPAGSTYPYQNDPNDSNIRIAPSFAEDKNIEIATRCLSTAIGLLSYENLLEN